MPAPEPQGSSSPAPDGTSSDAAARRPTELDEPADGAPQPPKKHRNLWKWLSAGLALVAAGLLIWALDTRSDLDGAQDQVAQLESQAAQAKDTGSSATAAAKDAYDEIAQQLGTTTEDLAATEQDLERAQQDAAAAEQEAAQAEQRADGAKDATEKADAQAAEAEAQVDAAEAKTAIAAECAKAYASAFGGLLEGGQEQVETVEQDLRRITDDCKAALSGA